MIATPKFLDRADTPREDHFVHLRGATWRDYERVLAIRGDRSAPRITYLDGTLEIMSPSRSHESIKSDIGCLVEVEYQARSGHSEALERSQPPAPKHTPSREHELSPTAMRARCPLRR